jgi:hypothetical protein
VLGTKNWTQPSSTTTRCWEASCSTTSIPLFEQEAKARQRHHGGTAPGRKSLSGKPSLSVKQDDSKRATAQAAKAGGEKAGRGRPDRDSGNLPLSLSQDGPKKVVASCHYLYRRTTPSEPRRRRRRQEEGDRDRDRGKLPLSLSQDDSKRTTAQAAKAAGYPTAAAVRVLNEHHRLERDRSQRA